jgi:FtsP/CotA-like multicopper oxidase with cupredoxin domain
MATTNLTDPRHAPKTGKIRPYNFVIERGTLAPDGVQKNGILINGQFPGPTIEANWGDTFQVRSLSLVAASNSLNWTDNSDK